MRSRSGICTGWPPCLPFPFYGNTGQARRPARTRNRIVGESSFYSLLPALRVLIGRRTSELEMNPGPESTTPSNGPTARETSHARIGLFLFCPYVLLYVGFMYLSAFRPQ